MYRSGSISSVVRSSSSGVGNSSSSIPTVPCLTSPSLQLNVSNLLSSHISNYYYPGTDFELTKQFIIVLHVMFI